MRTRILSSLVALPLFIVPIYFGGILFYGLVAVAFYLGLMEFDRAFKIKGKGILPMQLVCALLVMVIMWYEKETFYFSPFVLLFILLFINYVISYPKLDLKELFYGVVGFVYVPMLLVHVILVRQLPDVGLNMVWIIFIISLGSDTFAYFVGRSFGKRKLSKELSPKKTVEGAIGGVVGAALLAVLYGMYMHRFITDVSVYQYIGLGIMGAVGSVISQFGDISASAMKRICGIKDFGKLMPGHGGLLDRIDSIIFVAPFVYYALLFILDL